MLELERELAEINIDWTQKFTSTVQRRNSRSIDETPGQHTNHM